MPRKTERYTEEELLMIEGLIEGWNAELNTVSKGTLKLGAKPVIVKIDTTVMPKGQKVKEFLEETTEHSDNKKDRIPVRELYEIYDGWNRKKGGASTYIDTVMEFGKILQTQCPEYKKGKVDIRAKTTVVLLNLKYKHKKLNKVNEFLNKVTIKTENPMDRISVKTLTRMYNEGGCRSAEGSDEDIQRIPESIFKEQANLGDYRTKTCYEVGKAPGRTVEPCVMCVKLNETYIG